MHFQTATLANFPKLLALFTLLQSHASCVPYTALNLQHGEWIILMFAIPRHSYEFQVLHFGSKRMTESDSNHPKLKKLFGVD